MQAADGLHGDTDLLMNAEVAMGYFEADQTIGKFIVSKGNAIETVFDIGSSNGAWTNIMRQIFPGAWFELFEPLIGVTPSYDAGWEWVSSQFSNMRLHRIAIGDTDGTISINVSENPSGSSTIGSGAGKRVTVPLRTVDSLIAQDGLKVPDLIKMDIQGGEMNVLKGARKTLPKVKFLALETWLVRGYGPDTPLLIELIDFLKPYGFVPFDIGEHFTNAEGQKMSVDVWFANVKLVPSPSWYYAGLDLGSKG